MLTTIMQQLLDNNSHRRAPGTFSNLFANIIVSLTFSPTVWENVRDPSVFREGYLGVVTLSSKPREQTAEPGAGRQRAGSKSMSQKENWNSLIICWVNHMENGTRRMKKDIGRFSLRTKQNEENEK